MPNEHASSQEYRANNRISVLLPLPVAGPYDYKVPPDMILQPGDFVHAPLGSREMTGVVWGPAAGDGDEKKLFELLKEKRELAGEKHG